MRDDNADFMASLERARDFKAKENTLKPEHDIAVTQLRVAKGRSYRGRFLKPQTIARKRIERIYRRSTGYRFGPIDWITLWEWIVDHWVDILVVILKVLPFFLGTQRKPAYAPH